MTMRWRIVLAALVLIVLPLGGLSLALRARIAAQYTEIFNRQAAGRLDATIAALAQRGQRIAVALDGIARALQDDNQLRLAVVGGRDDLLPYVRDLAGRAMDLGGLQVLMLLDEDGVVISSGHYRNEFGRRDEDLAPLLEAAAWPAVGGGPDGRSAVGSRALAQVRLPDRTALALLALRTLPLADRRLHLVGGEVIDADLLVGLAAGQADLALVAADGPQLAPGWFRRHLPGYEAWADQDRLLAAVAATGHLVRHLSVPLIRSPAAPDGAPAPGRLTSATLLARVGTDPLRRLLHELDLTLGLALTAALAGAFGLAAWLSARLSRPLQDLAAQAARVDLDDPQTVLTVAGDDEVGRLARVLGSMVARLREDARRLADAEHRATMGEVARQVNHDLRNGLTPVRNVLRHLSQTAAASPDRLAGIFADRLPTLDGSLAYLEDLAGRYARLAPPAELSACDLGAIARQAALDQPRVAVRADPDAPRVLADPVALRRILDNLLRNARQALPPDGGRVTVTVARVADAGQGEQCRLIVRDDGAGMTPEVAARSGEDFFTTRPGGTGLGLSIVRRLAADAGGRLQIDSAPGAGTTVTITFPAQENEA